MPVVPLVNPPSYQFTVHEEDFADAIAALSVAEKISTEPIGIANPIPVSFRQIMERFARDQGRHCRFVPADLRLLNVALLVGERLPLSPRIRADSLLGLVRPAAFVPNLEVLESLGVRLRRFGQPVPPKIHSLAPISTEEGGNGGARS
jgi:hypothetical protein